FDSSGRLVAVGTYCGEDICPTLNGTTSGKAVVVRYLADGSLDTSFAGGKGWLTIPAMLGATAMGIDGSGRIVLGGIAISGTSTRAMAFARVTAAGAVDTSFGNA